MTTTTHALFATLLFAIAAQNAAPSVESRLREQLKGMAAHLKTAETEKATQQAEKTALTEKATSFEAASKKLGEQLVAETDKAKKDGERMSGEIAAKEAAIAETKAALAKATEFGTKAAQLAKKTEAERDKFSAEANQLKRVVADQRAKNGKMFEIGNEILTRYEKFGFGTAITAREPFVGITRARMETLIEEYGGKLAEQRLKAVGNTPASNPVVTSAKNSKSSPSDTKRPKD